MSRDAPQRRRRRLRIPRRRCSRSSSARSAWPEGRYSLCLPCSGGPGAADESTANSLRAQSSAQHGGMRPEGRMPQDRPAPVPPYSIFVHRRQARSLLRSSPCVRPLVMAQLPNAAHLLPEDRGGRSRAGPRNHLPKIPSPAAASAADRQEQSQPFTLRSLRSPVPGGAERPGQTSVASSQEHPEMAVCRRGSPSGLAGAGTSAGGPRRAPRPSVPYSTERQRHYRRFTTPRTAPRPRRRSRPSPAPTGRGGRPREDHRRPRRGRRSTPSLARYSSSPWGSERSGSGPRRPTPASGARSSRGHRAGQRRPDTARRHWLGRPRLKSPGRGTRCGRHQWAPLPRGKEKPVYIGLGTVVLIIVIIAVVMLLRRR